MILSLQDYNWFFVLGFNATLTAKVISWRSVMHRHFLAFLTPVLTQLFFPKPPTTFLICFCRGEKRKYARKKSHLKQESNSQPPGHESDTLTTEPPGWGTGLQGRKLLKRMLPAFSAFQQTIYLLISEINPII